jgi:signal peptidase II
MIIPRLLRTLLIITALSSNIGCDQISKQLVRERVDHNEQIGFVSNYVTLTRVENAGAFLSLGTSWPPLIKLMVLSFLPLMFIVFVCMYVLTTTHFSAVSLFGICSILGGGLGNIYDRLIYGSVTDFLHIDLILFETGVFNLADVSIMSGITIVIADAYFNRNRKLTRTPKDNV